MTMIEKVARAIATAEYQRRNLTDNRIPNDIWNEAWASEPHRRLHEEKARAAIKALAANLSDEMVAAASAIINSDGKEPYHVALDSTVGSAIEASLRAALTEPAGERS